MKCAGVFLFICPSSVIALRSANLAHIDALKDSFSFIDSAADECACTFSSTCSCDDAMKFLDCISAACESKTCKCTNGDHFNSACGAMGSTCPSIGLQCGANTATCNGESAGNSTAGVPSGYVPIEDHEAEIAKKRTHGHHLFAVLMLMLFILITSFFAFVQSSNKVLMTSTYAVIDSIAVVSIASTLFFIFDHLFAYLTGGYHSFRVTLHILYALSVFFIAMFGSWYLKSDPIGQTSFNAVIYFVCLLAKGGALTTAQSALPSDYLDVFLIIAASLAFFALLMFITHQIKPETGWYDEVETNLAGGAVAAGLCHLVGMLINGLDHRPHKAQDGDQAKLTALWALSTCVLAVVATPPMGRIMKANTKYWKGRFLGFLHGLIGILPYFTVSIGTGPVVCSALNIEAGTLMAKLVASVVTVAIGFLMIFLCAVVPYLKRQTDEVKALAGLILGFGGYIAGFSLSTLLVAAIDESLQGRNFTGNMLIMWKIVIIAGFNALLIPVYITYLKPLIIQKSA